MDLLGFGHEVYLAFAFVILLALVGFVLALFVNAKAYPWIGFMNIGVAATIDAALTAWYAWRFIYPAGMLLPMIFFALAAVGFFAVWLRLSTGWFSNTS